MAASDNLGSSVGGDVTQFNQGLKMAEEAQTKAKQICGDDLNIGVHHACTDGFKGFSLASGRGVKIPQDSLKKAQELFGDDLGNRDEDFTEQIAGPSHVKGFSTASGLESKMSVMAPSVSVEFAKPNLLPNNGFKGFSTASGAKMKLSEGALKNAHKIFGDDFKELGESEDVEKATEVGFANLKQVPNDGFKGFSTASGTKMKLSEAALKNAQKIFGDDFEELAESEAKAKQVPNNGFKGFSTASGTKMKFSERTLKDAQKVLGHDLEQLGESEEYSDVETSSEVGLSKSKQMAKSGFQGFSTASGTKMKLSDNALKNAQKIFGEDLEELEEREGPCDLKVSSEVGFAKLKQKPNSNNSFKGFSRASGTKMNISERALKNTQKIFGDDLEELGESEQTGYMKISSKVGFAKPKQLHNSDFKGFSTASGSNLKLSEGALKNAQKIFGDDLVELSNDEEACDMVPTDMEIVLPKNNFKGFSTASGSAMKLSEGALKNAQKLFGDDFEELEKCEGEDSGKRSVEPWSAKPKQLIGKKLQFNDNQGGMSDDDESFVCDTQALRKVESENLGQNRSNSSRYAYYTIFYNT